MKVDLTRIPLHSRTRSRDHIWCMSAQKDGMAARIEMTDEQVKDIEIVQECKKRLREALSHD